MTPEEIASDIVSSVPFIGGGSMYAGSPDYAALEMAIAQAIRDAYERAAVVAETLRNVYTFEDDLTSPGDVILGYERAASAIRALKE